MLSLTVLASVAGAQRGAVPSPAAAARTDTIAAAIAVPAKPLASEAASARVTRFSFIVYGDTRNFRDGMDVQAAHSMVVESMLHTIARLRSGPDPVRFVLQSGDAVVRGANATQWNVSFVPIVDRLATEGGVPYFLAVGNHDVASADTSGARARMAGLRNYFAAMAKIIPANGSKRRLSGYPTYAFGYGNMFVIAFDSNIPGDSTQFEWVRSQLEHVDHHRYSHIVVFFHHPALSSGPHGGPILERQAATIRERWMPLFRKNDVDLLFAGHEHLFEHWVEHWRDAKGNWHRLDQVVTGGGGAPIYTYRGEPDLRAYLAAGAADSLRVTHLVAPAADSTGNPHHYVVVHVDGAHVWQEVVGVDWGRDFAPYRSARVELDDPSRPPER